MKTSNNIEIFPIPPTKFEDISEESVITILEKARKEAFVMQHSGSTYGMDTILLLGMMTQFLWNELQKRDYEN